MSDFGEKRLERRVTFTWKEGLHVKSPTTSYDGIFDDDHLENFIASTIRSGDVSKIEMSERWIKVTPWSDTTRAIEVTDEVREAELARFYKQIAAEKGWGL